MTFEQALTFFGLVCAVLVLGLVICLCFNKHITTRNFYAYYCTWAAILLGGALILTAVSVITNTSSLRQTECRTRVAPIISELDLAARDYEGLLRNICV